MRARQVRRRGRYRKEAELRRLRCCRELRSIRAERNRHDVTAFLNRESFATGVRIQRRAVPSLLAVAATATVGLKARAVISVLLAEVSSGALAEESSVSVTWLPAAAVGSRTAPGRLARLERACHAAIAQLEEIRGAGVSCNSQPLAIGAESQRAHARDYRIKAGEYDWTGRGSNVSAARSAWLPSNDGCSRTDSAASRTASGNRSGNCTCTEPDCAAS